METILGQIEQTAETCRKSIATLEKLPECGFEAIQYYKITLDLDASIRKASEMAEIQRKKAEAEAEKPKTTPAAPQKEPEKAVQAPKEGSTQEAQKGSRVYTFVFETTVSIEQAKTLGDFCRANGIPLKNLTGKVREV
jgi:heme-binding NEAT domain protein